jgi:hypothetical protein
MMMTSSDLAGPLRAVLKSQFHAALGMLRDAIEQCPDDEWMSARHHNAFWQMAYHTLFYAHLYFGKDEKAFRRLPLDEPKKQFLRGNPARPDIAATFAFTPCTKAQVLDYWRECDAMVDPWVDAVDLESPESGFSWYDTSKLEHQLINLRHIQHHTAQLIERVRDCSNVGTEWYGTGAQVPARPA